jgi:hypothetical protein
VVSLVPAKSALVVGLVWPLTDAGGASPGVLSTHAPVSMHNGKSTTHFPVLSPFWKVFYVADYTVWIF